MLHSRLHTLKQTARELANAPSFPPSQPPLPQNLPPNRVEPGDTPLPTAPPHPVHFYDALLELSEKLFGGEMDQNVFEDTVRSMFGLKGYYAYSFDKIVSSLVKNVSNDYRSFPASTCCSSFFCYLLSSAATHDRFTGSSIRLLPRTRPTMNSYHSWPKIDLRQSLTRLDSRPPTVMQPRQW
jgi:C-terminal domain of Sin3a protein